MFIIFETQTGAFLAGDGLTWIRSPAGAMTFATFADARDFMAEFFTQIPPHKYWAFKMGEMLT